MWNKFKKKAKIVKFKDPNKLYDALFYFCDLSHRSSAVFFQYT